MAANPLQGAGTPAATVFGEYHGFMQTEQATNTLILNNNQAASFRTSCAVGNLAYDLSDQDVIDYFSKVGPVKAIR